MVPPAFAAPALEPLVEPPELGFVSSLPQAATPSASAAQQPRASSVNVLTGAYSSWSRWGFECKSGGTVAARGPEACCGPGPGYETRVTAPGRSGSRSRRACG